MSRDWASTLLPASWNGFLFHVESDGETAGHRLVTTAVPNGGYVVEGFGRKLREFKITAYLAEEAIEPLGIAFLAACEIGRPGILVLPMAGFVTARIKEAKRDFQRDRLGYLAFEIEAQEEWAAGTGLSVNAARDEIYALTAAIVAPLASGFAARLSALSAMPGARPRMTEQASGAVARLVDLRDAIRPEGDARAAIDAALAGAANAIIDLPSDPASFGRALIEAGQVLGEHGDPAFVQGILVNEAAEGVAYASSAAEAAVDLSFLIVTESALAIAMAEAVSRRAFAARPEAAAARSAISGAIGRARQALDGRDGAAGAVFAALEAAGATYLGLLAASLAPIVQVSAGRALPALWWSWYLHGDVSRDAAIVARAGAAHPGFMPVTFETLAPDARA
jgi:prophage DNA circulation protein